MKTSPLYALLTLSLFAYACGSDSGEDETPTNNTTTNNTTTNNTTTNNTTTNNTTTNNTTTNNTIDKDCEQATQFVQRDAAPENAAYAEPSLQAYCQDDKLIIKSNGIISFPFKQITPADMSAQNYTWELPLTPVWRDTPTEIPLLGTTAIAIDGIPFVGPNEGPPTYGDPIYDAIVDECFGHTAPQGDYHYHAGIESCILAQASAATEPSPLLGYALDGYPIYGSRGCKDINCAEVVTFKSGWELTGDPSDGAWESHSFVEDDDELTLDQCNGRTGPDGKYRYHITETFPYILGCYHGEAPAANTGMMGPPPNNMMGPPGDM